MIQAIFFDLDDTLHDSQRPFRRAMEQSFPHPYASVPSDTAYKMFRHFSDLLWPAYCRGDVSLADLRAERIIRMMEHQGFVISRQEAERFQACYEREQQRIELFSDASAVLTELQEMGLLIGIITNGPVKHQAGKIAALGLDSAIQSEHIFISDAVGIAKPDQQIFEWVARQVGHSPGHLLYVGDTWENDVAAAMEAGWHSIWYNHRSRKPETDHQPLAEIRLLSDILDVWKGAEKEG
ncbi:HAD family hydrolase [Ectobacillus ponti]|uniref:HAD family hydrolase n=1 Tax=Ectobacillus ponti TaxID=2961894 RepID=A0AA42BRY3_9BACI|nr:HAD family hydrolase [Ectobacillus ponti]MCP8969999.1 HAD family hydrolase [Ectobacillus ponti]